MFTKIIRLILLAAVLGGIISIESQPALAKGTLTQTEVTIKNTDTGLLFEVPVSVIHYANASEAVVPITQGMLNTVEMTALRNDGGGAPDSGGETWDYDSTYSIKLYIYMDYSKQTLDGYTHVVGKFYKGKWVRVDSLATVKRFDFIAKCYGENWIEPTYGDCTPERTHTSYKNNPANNTYYIHDTPWDHLWVWVVATDVCAHYDKVKATIVRASGTQWTFEICIGAGGSGLTNCTNLAP